MKTKIKKKTTMTTAQKRRDACHIVRATVQEGKKEDRGRRI